MLAELVLAYHLQSNNPVHLASDGPPFQTANVTLHIRQTWRNFHPHPYIDFQPYLNTYSGFMPGLAGLQVEAGFHFKNFDLGLYHHSAHNLDINGPGMQINGLKLTWKLFNSN